MPSAAKEPLWEDNSWSLFFFNYGESYVLRITRSLSLSVGGNIITARARARVELAAKVRYCGERYMVLW